MVSSVFEILTLAYKISDTFIHMWINPFITNVSSNTFVPGVVEFHTPLGKIIIS